MKTIVVSALRLVTTSLGSFGSICLASKTFLIPPSWAITWSYGWQNKCNQPPIGLTIFQVSRRFSQLLDELGLTPEANNVSDGVLSFVLWAGL